MYRFIFFLIFSLLSCCRLKAAMVVVKTGEGGNYFAPSYFVINPGDTVKWIWIAGHHNTASYSLPAGATGWYSNLNSTSTEFIYVPLISGLYNYTCTHHSGMDGSFLVTGCAFPDKPLITASWKSDPCPGGASVLLRITSQAGATYQWLKGVTTVAGGIADSLLVSDPGSYTVTVNRCGVDSLSMPYSVAAYPLPVLSFDLAASGLHYNFTNTCSATAGYHFRWRFGDGSPGYTGVHALHTYSTHGSYPVTLFISDSLGRCADSLTKTLHTELGLGETGNDIKVSVFPNPSTNELNIQSPADCHVQLQDLYGRILTGSRQYAKQHTLRTDSFAPGCYLLHLRYTGGQVWVHRIILR